MHFENIFYERKKLFCDIRTFSLIILDSFFDTFNTF